MRIRCNSMWRQAVSRHVEDRKDEVRELTLHVPYVSLLHYWHHRAAWNMRCIRIPFGRFARAAPLPTEIWPKQIKLKICLSEKYFFKKNLLLLLLPLLFWVHFRNGFIRRKQVYKRHWLVTQWRIVALFVSHKTKIKFGHGIGFLCEVQRGLIWVIRQFWVKSTSIQPHMYVPKLLLACRYSSTGGLVLQSWFELQIDLRRQTCKFW